MYQFVGFFTTVAWDLLSVSNDVDIIKPLQETI